ncbi:MAG: epoxide hydrolase [Actinomycetia bacterium]|nr:epoxide hydrolase [Actinomycetes bacterium]MCP5033631.1 epoxide hydrolase [Actinomycetes bacterium]
MSAPITPFKMSVDDLVLDDLRQRLRATRWPESEVVDDWSQGAPLAYVQEVCTYWADTYDWRSRETALNRFDQFMTPIAEVDIHFIHVRSAEPDAFPLLITHGWPGSIVEFHKIIEPLTNPTAHGGDPSDAFHVVCPSLPGYGFSGKPRATGWGVPKVAEAWAELMARLGYDRYGAQGGDWGAAVTTAIGSIDPDHCAGIHLNMPLGRPGPDDPIETETEKRAVTALQHYQDWDSGYSKQQSTRPQTLGYGLTDSPAGQAAWILEKFWAWTDCDGHPENALSRDEMLDNIMFYWVNAAATSSARIYWESFGRFQPDPVTVPTGIAAFPREILPAARRWCDHLYRNIRHWTDMDRGGHFAAFEQPELFVDDVRAFFRLVQ